MNKNFLRGMSEAINLFPHERKTNISLPTHSDEESFRKDLEQVGSDMRFAIKSVERSKNSRNQKND